MKVKSTRVRRLNNRPVGIVGCKAQDGCELCPFQANFGIIPAALPTVSKHKQNNTQQANSVIW